MANLGMIELSFILLGVMILLLGSGIWIAVSLGLVGFVAMALTTSLPLGSVLATTTWSASSSWTLAALPLFIWMGEILFRTKLSEEMFRGLSPWVQWLPGRLTHVNVIGCGIFAAVSGSSAATCATIGKIALPEPRQAWLRQGPEPGLARGLRDPWSPDPAVDPDGGVRGHGECVRAAGVPRRLPAGRAGDGAVLRLHHHLVAAEPRQSASARSADVVSPEAAGVSQARTLPVADLRSLFSLVLGFATATECAAWGVTGALLLAWWSGTLTRKNFLESIMSATRLTCMIMLILAGAAYTTAAMAYTGIPAALATWVQGQQLTPGMLALYLSIMYIILGCLIDGISMIVLTAVIVLPMVKQAGLDLVWFGVYLIIHVEMAQITPPVGFNLFVLQNMSGRDTFTVARAAFPFFILLLASVFIITEYPQIVMFLPKLAFPD